MKERYLKHIKYDLTLGCNKYPFLTKEDLKELRRGYVFSYFKCIVYCFKLTVF